MNIDVLISSVYRKRPLWDQKDAQHHNRFILDKLWDVVAEEMKSSRNIVRSKWKNFRDTFRKELKKKPIKHSGEGASDDTNWKSSWAHFDSLNFLKDQFTCRTSTGNLPDIESNSVMEDITNESNLEELDHIIMESPSASNEEPNDLPNTSCTSTPVSRKRKRKNDIGTTLINIEQNKLRILEQQTKKKDEDEFFFESLLPHVRPLRPQHKMLLRIKMQELVYNFVYENQDNRPQLTQLQTVSEYSNPTSVQSYYSNFSE